MANRKDAAASSTSSRSGQRRLGRGLGSLISAPVRINAAEPEAERGKRDTTIEPSLPGQSQESTSGGDSDQIIAISLSEIYPNPNQPRQRFDEAALESLAQSIRTAGVMQPIVVRPRPRMADGFELVAGERRWRAAARIGLSHIPAIVRSIDDRQVSELALIENLQREDLNPVERAEAFQRLITEFNLTHQQVAEQVGLTRSNISNHLRLLELEREVLDLVREDLLSFGHARALLVITNKIEQKKVAAQAIREAWSVREIERQTTRPKPGTAQSPNAPPTRRQAQVQDLERRLGEHLGTRVRIRPGRKKGAGSVEISFYSPEEFEGIMDRLGFRVDESD